MKNRENIIDSKSSKMSLPLKYELIVAMNQDSIIGVTDLSGNQRIPWKNKEDMRHFRETTMGHILIMGRKTFESLPKRPLPGRIHIVLTRNPSEYTTYTDNTVFFATIEQLDKMVQSIIRNHFGKRVFVCGGEEIYRILLPRCERLHITEINHSVELNPGETTSQFSSKKEWMAEFSERDDTYDPSILVCKIYDRIKV